MIRTPYIGIALVIVVVFVAIALTRMPSSRGGRPVARHRSHPSAPVAKSTVRRGGGRPASSTSVPRSCAGPSSFTTGRWSWGLSEVHAQGYNIVAMIIFVTSRFICTFLLKYVSPGGLLMTLALGGGGLTLGTIFIQGMVGLYCLVGISACMSLMFPTIYGIALEGRGGGRQARRRRPHHGDPGRIGDAAAPGRHHRPSDDRLRGDVAPRRPGLLRPPPHLLRRDRLVRPANRPGG